MEVPGKWEIFFQALDFLENQQYLPGKMMIFLEKFRNLFFNDLFMIFRACGAIWRSVWLKLRVPSTEAGKYYSLSIDSCFFNLGKWSLLPLLFSCRLSYYVSLLVLGSMILTVLCYSNWYSFIWWTVCILSPIHDERMNALIYNNSMIGNRGWSVVKRITVLHYGNVNILESRPSQIARIGHSFQWMQ